MKRLDSVLVICAFLAFGCDLKDKSIGDDGGAMSDDGGGDGDGDGDAGDDAGVDDGGNDDGGNDDGMACTLIGCEDGVSISIVGDALPLGQWQIDANPLDESPAFSCGFVLGAGGVSEDTCGAFANNGEIMMFRNVTWSGVDLHVSVDGLIVGAVRQDIEYQEVAPNGPGCGPICNQGALVVPVGESESLCEDLQVEYRAEFDAAQACTDASECGQTLSHGSCGCTRDPVVRLDVDISSLDQLWNSATALECEFTQIGSTCDCPEADGFACIDNACTWNYL